MSDDVKVTQADREAAAAIYQRFRDHDYAKWILDQTNAAGEHDSVIQAFARHRTAANADVDRLEGLLLNPGVGLVKMWACYGGGFMLSVNGDEHHAGSVADAIDAAFKGQIK